MTRALVNYLSFFTILTNIVVALGLIAFMLQPTMWTIVCKTGSLPKRLSYDCQCRFSVYCRLFRVWPPSRLPRRADHPI